MNGADKKKTVLDYIKDLSTKVILTLLSLFNIDFMYQPKNASRLLCFSLCNISSFE